MGWWVFLGQRGMGGCGRGDFERGKGRILRTRRSALCGEGSKGWKMKPSCNVQERPAHHPRKFLSQNRELILDSWLLVSWYLWPLFAVRLSVLQVHYTF